MSAKTELRIDFRGVDKTAQTLRGMGDGIKGFAMKAGAALAGAFAVNKIITGTQDLIKGLHKIGDTARKVGIDSETYQRLGFALSQVGLQAEDAGTYLAFMRKNIGLKGDMKGNIFERMGMDLNALKNMKPEQQFESITRTIAGMGNETDRVQALTEIFGRKGAELAPLLRQGPEAFAEGLRGVMGMVPAASNQAVDMASNIDDAFGAVGMAMKADMSSAFLSIMNNGTEAFGRIDVAIFAAYQKVKLFAQNTMAFFGWIKDGAEALFTEKTFAGMESLSDRFQKNIEESMEAVENYKVGVEAKDTLAAQLKEAGNAGDGLKAKVNGVKAAVQSLAQIGLGGTYDMIKAQYAGLGPSVGGMRRGEDPAGRQQNQAVFINMQKALQKIAENTEDTADGISDLEEV